MPALLTILFVPPGKATVPTYSNLLLMKHFVKYYVFHWGKDLANLILHYTLESPSQGFAKADPKPLGKLVGRVWEVIALGGNSIVIWHDEIVQMILLLAQLQGSPMLVH